MARIGILPCSNCTQDSNCASVVCLGEMRRRKGFFERYPKKSVKELLCQTLAPMQTMSDLMCGTIRLPRE